MYCITVLHQKFRLAGPPVRKVVSLAALKKRPTSCCGLKNPMALGDSLALHDFHGNWLCPVTNIPAF